MEDFGDIKLKKYVYEKYNTLKWYEKYDLIEFLIKFFYDIQYKGFANNIVIELNNIKVCISYEL